jgi:hypothetical protein
VRERGEEAIDADRRADRGKRRAEEAHHQIVVAAAAEDGAELRRVEEDRLEHRAGVVGQTAGDGEIERHAVVAVAEVVEVTGDALDHVELFARVLDVREELAHLGEDIAALVAFDGEEGDDAIDLLAGEADAANDVARLVFVAFHQFETDLLEADLVELVEDAEDVDPLFGGDAGEREQQIEDGPAGEADQIALDAERGERVAHPGDDFGVGDLAVDADRVEVELGELAVASLVRLVGAPDRRDLVAAEGAGELRILRDDACQRRGEVEAEAEVFFLRIADAEDRLLRFLAGAAGEDVEELDGGGGQRNEAVVFVDAADGVDHPLASQHLIGKKVAEAAGEARDDGISHSGFALER